MDAPLPVYHFRVEWGGARLGFTEVTGLTMEAQVIEYREGDSPDYSPTKMPGLEKYGDVTLRRGVVQGDGDVSAWFDTIASHTVERRDVTISLLNHEHEPAVVWKLRNAWPTKVAGPTLDASANQVAIEELVLAHEGLTIET